MRNTPKNAVSKAKRRIDDVMFSNLFFIWRLYLDANTMTYKDNMIPIVPQIEISLDNSISDWKDE
jgi:hypothetical protein